MRGATKAAAIGLISALFIAPVLWLLGKPIYSELILMLVEGTVLTGVGCDVDEFLRQRKRRT